MADYSISEAARQLGIQRRTLYKWIREKYVPAPSTRVVAGTRIRFWSEKGMVKLRQFKATRFWGKGKAKKRGRVPRPSTGKGAGRASVTSTDAALTIITSQGGNDGVRPEVAEVIV